MTDLVADVEVRGCFGHDDQLFFILVGAVQSCQRLVIRGVPQPREQALEFENLVRVFEAMPRGLHQQVNLTAHNRWDDSATHASLLILRKILVPV